MEKSFWDEIKNIFHRFWRAFSCQKLHQIWERAFKYKPRYDLQSKMSWHSDFESFTDKLFQFRYNSE